MQTMVPTGRANYEPNSLGSTTPDGTEISACPREDHLRGFHTTSAQDVGPAKLRVRPERFGDHYSQASQFWSSQSASEQAHIASAFVFELSKVTVPHVVDRVLSNLGNVSPELAQRVATGLGQEAPPPSALNDLRYDAAPSHALSIHHIAKPILAGRTIGILIGEGAPKKTITTSAGSMLVDGQLAGTPSCVFDAVAVILEEPAAEALASDGAAVQFVSDAFGHLKALGTTEQSTALFERAGVVDDVGVIQLSGDFAPFLAAATQRQWDREPFVRLLA
jgi:catalase